jgi:hypothetical protein
MAKKTYTYDPAIKNVAKGEKPKVYRAATGKNAGYDFLDPQGGAIAKAAAKGIGRGIMRVVAGPRR